MRLTTLSILSICYLLTGCSSYYNSASEPLAYPKDTIWSTAYKVIDKRYEIATSNKEEGTIETDWDYKLSPMYLQSYRDRISLLVEKYDIEKDAKKQDELDEPDTKQDTREKYVIKISVENHQNRSLDSPNSKDDGFWFPNGFNRSEEQRLINFIHSQLSIMQYIDDDVSDDSDEEPES